MSYSSTYYTGEVVSDVALENGDSLILSGGTAVNTTMSGGLLSAWGGSVLNTTIEGGAVFSAIADNNIAKGTTVNSGGSVIFQGGELDSTTVNSYGHVGVYGGTVTNMTLNTSGSAYFDNRGTVVNDLIINGTESYQYTTAVASNGVIVNGATVVGNYAYLTASNANVNNVQLDGGVLRMSGSATATDVAINEGGSMSMEGSATATGVSVNQGGWFSAGFNWYGYYGDLSAIGATVVENGGAVYVGSGSVSNYIEDETGYGYYVSSTEFFPVTFQSNVFSKLVYSTGRGGTVHSGTTAVDITARRGGLAVYDGGVVEGYTVTPYTYDSAYERWQYHEHYNSETEDWEYTSEFVSGVETVTELGNLTVVAGGTVTGLVAQAMPGDEYSWGSYLNFEIAPNTLITGTIDGQSFMVQNGDMRPGLLKNANLTYMGGIIASGVTQINGSATFNEGVIASDMVFSGTSVTFNRGATVEFVRTAPVPYVYTEYEGGFGDQEEEPEETIVSSFMGAHVDVYAGAQVRSIEMTDKDYLHMQVAPNTVLTGTSGGVELNMTNGVFTSASLGSTYVEVMGGTTSIDETTAGTAVTIAGGTVSDLIVNPGACVSAAEGATALNLTENGGAVWIGWDNDVPETITYSFTSNTFSYEHLAGGENGITVHKNTSAVDNIMFGGDLTVFSGGVVSNFYTVGSGMNMNQVTFLEGAIVSNFDTVRYSDPGKYHPGHIDFNKNVTVNVARLTDYDGLTFFVGSNSVLTNGSIDNVPFSIENGVLSGFMGSEESWFGDTIGIYRGAGMIDCRTDQWANVNIWQGGYGSNNTFADGYVYVGETAYDDESEEGGIALLEKSTLGVKGNRDKSTTLYVQDNGVVRDITVNAGSQIEVWSGGKLTGKIRKGSNTISVSYGGVLDFDITAQDALTEARIDSLWNVTNNGRYSITIDGTNQAAGTYVLADATYFNDIFFWNDNAVIYFDLMDVSGSTFGYFYMAEENQYHYDEETGDEWYESVVAINYVATSREQQPNFEFSLSEGRRASESPGAYYTTLLFTVDSTNVAPEWLVAPTVTADVITFTPTDVVLTVEYSDDAVTKEYSLDGQIWTAFPADGAATATIVSGATAAAGDEGGNYASQYIPSNYPTSGYVGDVTGGTTTMTDGGNSTTTGGTRAVIPADEDEPAAGTDTTLTVTGNGTYFFRGTNANGVVSDVTSFRVSNIDKVAPTAPTDLDSWTTENEDGSVTLTFGWTESTDDYSGIRKYIVSYWQKGSADVTTVETPYKYYSIDFPAPVPGAATIGADGAVITDIAVDTEDWCWSVQAVDYAGNVSEVATFDDGSISGPELVADITKPTNTVVHVSVIGSPDAAQIIQGYEYSLDGQQTWNQVPADGVITVSENGVVWVRGLTIDQEYTGNSSIRIDNIDLIAPDAPIPDASTREPTNGYVIVTATFSNDSVTRECSLDGVNWVEYTSNGLSFVDNGFAYFRGIDAAGNVSDVAVYEVSNIDKVPPTAPVASMTIADTFDGVFVSAIFSDDTIKQEYSFEGKRWIAYDGAVPVSEIGTTVFFRGFDAAGNESEITTFTVNSFNVGPDAPVATADVTALTNGDVTVSAVFATDAVDNEYSMDGRTWSVYTDGLVFTENGTVYFRSKDAEGNYSQITPYTVDNIDKVAPEAPIAAASTNEATNQGVLVTATFSNDTALRECSTDGVNWTEYSENGILLSDNGKVFFRGTDAAGNVSEVTEYEVTNIDLIPPTAPVASMTVADTFDGALVSALFSDDSVEMEYSFEGKRWISYEGAVPVSELGTTVFFRGIDAAGNVSEVTSFTVNSFTVGPDAPVAISGNTEPTNQDVYVTARFDETAAVNEYSLDGQTWLPYPEDPVFAGGPIAVKVTENGTVYFRSMDAEGNYSAVTACKVDNIDKVAPEAPIAYADITEPTNQNVTVYATFSDDFAVRNYYLNSTGLWYAYDDAGIVLTANDTIIFAGNDAAGNFSPTTTFVVSNIDTTPPNAPVASLSAATAFEGVLVSATFSEDSRVREYSLDGRTWQAYQDAVPVTEIGQVVYFRGTDAAGNVSDVTECKVESFVLGPDAPVATADITAPTNQDVTVTATFDAAAALNQYSLNGMDWFSYTEGIVLDENGVVYFRSLDADGRESTITTVTVDNIDKEGPNPPYAYLSTTELTNQDVTVYAFFSDDSVVRQYRLSSNVEEWLDYPDSTGVVLSENDSVVFRGIDAAGNESEAWTFITVTNIDKVAPDAPTVSVSAAVLPAGQGIDVTATFSDDSVRKEYSLDGRTWLEYNGPVLFTELGTAYFRGTDAAGNVSEVTSYYVETLSLGPAAPYAFADITAPTNRDVTVYASFDDSAVVRMYSTDKAGWYDYTDDGVVLSQNGTLYFLCVNADGDYSDITTFTVSNIDKVAPQKPVATASTTENTFEPVVVTATFSEDSVKRQYSYDGREGWYDYPEDGITFETNGYVYFRGIDAAGNVSNLTAIDVTNILEAEPDDAAADNGWNDVVYDKKAKELTEAAWEVHAYDLTEVYRFQTNAPTLKLQLDKFGSISENDMTNAVGGKRTENGKTVYDVDCMRIEMSVAGWVSLAVKATQAVKLSIIQVTWADDRVKMKTLQTTKVKADDFTLSKPLLIDPMNGEDSLYFVTVEGISPKKDGVAYYRVALDMGQSQIFFQADNSDDWTDLKENGDDSYEFRDLGMLEDYFDEIAGVDFSREDWVGYGSDNIDYCKFTLENNATLTFRVDAEDAVKFGIYTLAGKEGSYSLKNALKPTSTSSGLLEKTLQLEAGTYYFSVEANTKKVFDAAYNVEISGMIYDRADHDDDWTDLNANGPDGLVYDAGTFTEDTIGTPLEEEGWVGFGDEIDYKVFRISGPAKLNFTIGADDAVKLTVYEVKRNKNGKWSLTAFNKNVATITAPKDGSDFYKEVSTGSIFLSDSNAIYAYSVQSTNARKGGSADYNVMLDSDGSGFIPVQKDPEGVDNSGLLIKTKGFLGGTVEIMDLEQWASDSLVVNGNIGYQGWVGYGDAVDTLGFSLTADTPIQSISIESTDQISVVLSQVIRSGKSVYKTKKILSSTKLYAADPLYTGYSYALIWDGLDGTKKKTINLGAGDYIISIKSTNASKGGNASYKLTLGCEALQKVQNADALTDLSMPETSDALASSDDLSLGQFAETSSAISSAVTDALDDKLGSVMNASWTTLA